ncbi:MAG TPA: methyltransferase domain-containing protein [Planctomycetota bacterium]|nr:methyltransferase domain-containing protein [Planctomycetota bacterium]
MKIAVLVASRNRPDLVEAMAAALEASTRIPYDLYVVECGSDRDKLSPHSTLWYPDPDFRGKCYGHNLALQAARLKGDYDYYWVLMNDVVFESGVDAARILVETLEKESRMAILSPTHAEGGYPSAAPRPGGGWRAVATCDYLGFMMRASALEEVGFLDPAFRYCWGAIHELAHRLYLHGWFVAYSDDVSYRHLGGSTYGAKGTNTISREEYQRRAKRFAYDYFRERYGDNWDEAFWRATAGHAIEVDTFREHKALWASGFAREELRERGRSAVRAELPPERRMRAEEQGGGLRLHLGCGSERREGWVNVDANPAVKPDLVSCVESLPAFEDGSAAVIEACHLFEHLTYDQALAALKEWHRVLAPGGELFLELPDLDACIRILGKHRDERGIDLGMIGLYGWPPDIAEEGVPQIHKWAWSKRALAAELRKAGFGAVEFGPITQTWRVAAKFGRDMRVRAAKAATELAAPAAELAPAASRLAAGAAPYPDEVLDTVDWKLVDEIKALHPWFYPVTLKNLQVTPGVGTHVTADYLQHRAACRSSLLVDEVGRRVDLRGKSVLELACNSAWWSARYAERGAARVVGMEGRDLYRRQAELYWSSNAFLPEGSYRFLQGNVSDPADWKALRELGPYDVTLCAGILYHVPNYREILSWAAEVTREVLIVDTRVGDAAEELVEEPGELFFNAIPETRVKVVPNLDKLLAHLRTLGFEPEVLPVGFPAGLGVDDVDNYADGSRVAVVARKVAVRTEPSAALPGSRSSPIESGAAR